MAKKIEGYLKFMVPAGSASPSPPLVLRWASVA